MLCSKTFLNDCEKLCSLDCLGIGERRDDSNYIYKELQMQLRPWGFYETNLIRKNNPPPLKTNKSNSLDRLSGLMKDLMHRNQLERYHNIIQDQI